MDWEIGKSIITADCRSKEPGVNRVAALGKGFCPRDLDGGAATVRQVVAASPECSQLLLARSGLEDLFSQTGSRCRRAASYQFSQFPVEVQHDASMHLSMVEPVEHIVNSFERLGFDICGNAAGGGQ
jgi:hypothetical protein